jgi:hypothetical protein
MILDGEDEEERMSSEFMQDVKKKHVGPSLVCFSLEPFSILGWFVSKYIHFT